MAGVTSAGFVRKTFDEIVAGLQEQAKPIFQDLVQPGEEVDTSDLSTLGRLIGLIAPSLDEVWQAQQQIYQAFDPNSATGVALDNIVQYLGITRQTGSRTVLRASVWGQLGTVLPIGQVIRGTAPDRFVSTSSLTFNTNDFIGFTILPTSTLEGSNVEFTFIVEEGIYTLAHTVLAGETVQDILLDLESQFNALMLQRSEVWVEGGKLYFQLKDYYSFVSVPSLTNCSIMEVKKRLSFQSEEDGDISAPVGTVTTILTPVFGWISVINEVTAEPGTLDESDEQLRERFRLTKAVRANNLAEAIYAQLIDLEDVDFARVYENTTSLTDTRGLPPHSFRAIVKGGADTNIGEIIWNNKPLGIASDGNTSVVVRDSQNLERTVKFSRPTEVPIYVKITVEKIGNTFPTNGVDDIRQAVVDYINDNANFGQELIYTRFFTPINSVPGHQVNVLEIGTSVLTLGTTNIVLGWDEFPVGLPENIDITVI